MTGVAGPLTKSLPVCVFDSARFAFNGELLFCLQQQKSNQKNAATDDCAPVFHTGIPAEGGFKSTAKTESKQVAIVCINQDVSP